jgi:ABC-type Fe3+ transport system substrate-binding protein
MNARLPSTLLSSIATGVGDAAGPDIGMLDFLGRMPIPLRRAFKAGLDRTVAAHRAASGERLDCCFLSGAEWYQPFDGLAAAAAVGGDLPTMLVSHFSHDILAPSLLARYAPREPFAAAMQSACADAGLVDPLGIFRTFAAIPFVFLVDEKRLRGRRAPRAWSDLLDPVWAGDIVFGGWRPNERVPYQDYNSYLLLSLYLEFGATGIAAFAGNVKHLQHNIRTATQAGSNAAGVGTIAVLPWLQAELCPRRERTRVVWPEDGALVMPIGYLVRRDAEARAKPLVDFVNGDELGRMLVRNCYPPTGIGIAGAFPEGARLKWPGWERLRGIDVADASREAAGHFFVSWRDEALVRACG